MEYRDKSAVPARKLIQARLPFKRLNPVPKEKPEANPAVKKARSSLSVSDQNTPCPGLPDNVENSCEVGTETPFASELVNGKGPLDSFVQKKTKNSTNQSLLLIDLTEDDCHGLSDREDRGKPDDTAVHVEKELKETEKQAGPLMSLFNVREHAQLEMCPEKDESSNVPPVEMETTGPTISKLEDVTFEKTLPADVLEDIVTPKSPQNSLSERSLASGTEMTESCPAEETACVNSSLSSLSPTSSPEVLSARECKEDDSPLAASTPARKTSQKTHRTFEEKEKVKQQRQAEREEKEKLREEAKVAKERAREEAKRKKEEEKELREKERRERKEKEEKEKAEKLRAKEEKRKERQEVLEAKLEEKRKKEEEKRLKEEEKRIKAEKAEITRFLQKPKTQPVPKTLAGWCGKFAPFEIKENMVLAPSCRIAVDPEALEQLDRLLRVQSGDASFLEELKRREPCKSGPTPVPAHEAEDADSDVVLVSSGQAGHVPERKTFGRMKLLQFCENHRPAYWGTWNKKSSAIKPKKPWSRDEKLLDYEVESDEEWEEEEPGESLSHSEGDDDEDGGEEEDDDDGFFVPHGYLSEDEGVTEECDPENQKVRQKLKAKEWDELIMKGKRLHVLQPVKVGCVWEGAEDSGGRAAADQKLLRQFSVAVLDSSVAEEEQVERRSKQKMRNQQILGQLIPLLHGNVNSSRIIIQEFQECCRLGLMSDPSASVVDGPARGLPSQAQTPPCDENALPSKARLKRLISENSVYEKRPDHRMCWYVHPEVLKSYGRENLPVPSQWNYVTQAPPAAKEDGGNSPGGTAAQTTPVAAKRKPTGSMSITKFMKKTPEAGQADTAKTDGFQADTEEDDDDDCIIMEVEPSQAPVDARIRSSETVQEMEQQNSCVTVEKSPTSI